MLKYVCINYGKPDLVIHDVPENHNCPTLLILYHLQRIFYTTNHYSISLFNTVFDIKHVLAASFLVMSTFIASFYWLHQTTHLGDFEMKLL